MPAAKHAPLTSQTCLEILRHRNLHLTGLQGGVCLCIAAGQLHGETGLHKLWCDLWQEADALLHGCRVVPFVDGVCEHSKLVLRSPLCCVLYTTTMHDTFLHDFGTASDTTPDNHEAKCNFSFNPHSFIFTKMCCACMCPSNKGLKGLPYPSRIVNLPFLPSELHPCTASHEPQTEGFMKWGLGVTAALHA